MSVNDADLTGPPDTGPPDTGTASATEPANAAGTARLSADVASGIARGAALIAALTLLSRVLGLVRTLVFAQTVGSDCLGTVYVTAYQVPNLLSELVLAGALTNAMVPVLARSAQRASQDAAARDRVRSISSAMLTWTVVILLPITVAVAAAAGPIASVLNPVNSSSHCARSVMVGSTGVMLQVFAPQVVLYGLSVVIFGMLQAYRRFTGPALAPVVASLVLIAAYLVFVPLNGGAVLTAEPTAAVLVLAVGTTLNVAALVVVGWIPVRRLGLRLRPTLKFPAGLAGRVGGLALVGVLEFIANDICAVVVIVLANGHGDTGALVVFNYAALVFNAVTAVLTLSITTSAFPVLSARDGEEFNRTCAGSTRAVLLMSLLGTAVIAAVAVPAAHVLVHSSSQVTELVTGFAAFAPGIAGTAVITNLSRVMFAVGRLRVACAALTCNWMLVIVFDGIFTLVMPPRLEVLALALGNTLGQTCVAVPLVIATRLIRGQSAVAGVRQVFFAGLLACAAGGVAGVTVADVLVGSGAGRALDVAGAVAAALCAMLAFGCVAFLLDRGDLRAIVRQAARRLRAGRDARRVIRS